MPPLLDISKLLADRDRLLTSARAAALTQSCYACDWRDFIRWCEAAQLAALPASNETVSLYLTATLARRTIATTKRRLSALRFYHRLAGSPAEWPDAKRVLQGARRLRPEKPRQKLPLTVEQLAQICAQFGSEVVDVRNRAMLVFGFASALRRHEIVAADFEHVVIGAEGIIVHVQREKNDQAGRGRRVGLCAGTNPSTDPVRTLREWIGVRGEMPGPLFLPVINGRLEFRRMHPQVVSRVVKAAVSRLDCDPRHYGGHSLRAGLVTAAGDAGCSDLAIAKQTGHRSLAMVRRYFRSAEVFRGNVSAAIGL